MLRSTRSAEREGCHEAEKLTLTAVLTAAALVMFVLESQLPPLTAIPGIKPGLSNIFTLFTMETLGPGWAFGLFSRASRSAALSPGRVPRFCTASRADS